ncbi:MAG: tetratricopeptide repeat protein [Anaerolineales bacterium]
MTEIALRTYNQEIKDLIDHGHFDEAIAHCQHILETFPRHIETYRLLGKAFLEQGRHGDAADVFQRVLSAIPEDWLSHVAMAIVREDESNLDMAIWHMERAYEVNPSNPTVQQEVRRLRGRRDGVEPPKLRLTRSALARMYIKGGLYGQAIAEIRSALNEDPDRPDLQVLLASALFDSGAVQEAADICTAILQKLPYCLEANRVMGMALQASNKQEDAEKLFQRIESLDPHIDLDILKKERRIAEHPGQTVSLSRLEYEGQEKTVRSKQPSWASSLGLKIEEPQKGPAIPDWLANASQPAAAFPPAAQPAAPAAPTGDIPSWLNEASAAVNQPGAGGSIFGTPVEPLPPAAPEPVARTSTGELPDWIQAQAPPAEQPAVEKPSGPLPDWLSAATMPPLPITPEPTTGSTLPDWIKTSSLPPEKPKEKISDIPDWLSAPPPPSVEALPSSSLPEWTKPETKTSPLGVEPNNIPDWLSSSQPTSVDIPPEPEWMKQAPPAAPGTDAIPEWMKGVGPVEPAPAAQPEEGMPDWLKESTAPASKPVELVPEWMRTESPVPDRSGSATPPIQAVPVEALPEWMKPDQNEAPISYPSSEPVLGAKTRTSPLAKEQSAAPAASVAGSEPAMPDWMNPPVAEPAASAAGNAEAVPESIFPDWLKPPPSAAVEAAVRIPEAAPNPGFPDWMNPAPAAAPSAAMEPAGSMAEPEIAPPTDMAPVVAEEPAPEIALPDWLRAVPTPAPEPAQPPPPVPAPVVAPPVDSLPIAELPDWLKGGPPQTPPLASKPLEPAFSAPPVQKTEPTQPAAPAEEIPLSEPGPTHVTPTASDGIDLPDWLVSQLQGKPAEAVATATPPTQTAAPLPDWLKASAQGSPPASVVDWDKAASQPVPPAPVDATRPATGLSQNAPAEAGAEAPGMLKPTGSDTVARWLDRRLKTSTLSSLDESALKAGVKPSTPPPTGKPGSGTQLPTWLDSQKPGGSDTVVRWMDKRETGSLRKVTASFSAVSRNAVPAPAEKPAPAPEAPPKAAAPAQPASLEAEVSSPPKQVPAQAVAAAPVYESSAPVFPKRETPPAPKPPEAVVSRPPIEPVLPVAAPAQAEDDEEGAFVPPPEWLQKALGSAVAEVPPIPKKQTGGLRPGTVSPVGFATQNIPQAPSPAAAPTVPSVPAPVERAPAVIQRESPPVDEPPPAATAKPGAWVPLAPAPAAPAAKPEKPAKKPARKKPRKLTDVEAEALIREARVYLETDLQKATEAYQQVIDDPSSAQVVVGDLTTYLEQDPASPQLWNLLGDACSRAGRLQDAYRAYAEALHRM